MRKLVTNRCFWAMPRKHVGCIGQLRQVAYALHHLKHTSARKIYPAYRTFKKRIASKGNAFGLAIEHTTALRMARRVNNGEPMVTPFDAIGLRKVSFHARLLLF